MVQEKCARKTELEKKAETRPVQGVYIVTYSQAKIGSCCCS